MDYEEKVIDGVLCCKNSESKSWIPFTPKELTVIYIAEMNLSAIETERADKAEERLEELKALFLHFEKEHDFLKRDIKALEKQKDFYKEALGHCELREIRLEKKVKTLQEHTDVT